MPDILIEVNYETLMIEPDVDVSLFESVIGVYAGFTNDPMYLTRKTESIPLPPSAHYLAPISIEIRKALKHPALSALGMFEVSLCFECPYFLVVILTLDHRAKTPSGYPELVTSYLIL